MKNISIVITFFMFVVLAVQETNAESRSWDLDKNHSNIYFSVPHIFSDIRGSFDEFSGKFAFDSKNLSESVLHFKIKTKSVNTNVSKRDKHLRSGDFFDSGNHPLIVFESTEVTTTNDDIFLFAGKLQIKGIEYDLVLPLTLIGIKNHPMEKGKDVLGFTGKVTLDRLTHKIGTGKFMDYGVVGKDVEVTVSVELLSDR